MILLRSRVAYSDYRDMEDTPLHSEATTATTATPTDPPVNTLCFGESDWLDFLQKLPPASFESLLSVCKKIQESRARCASHVQQHHPTEALANVTEAKFPLSVGRSEGLLDIPISGVCLKTAATVERQLTATSPLLYRTSPTEVGDQKHSSSFLAEVDGGASFSTASETRPTEDLTDTQHVTASGLDKSGTGNEDYLSLSTLASAAVAMANTSPEMSVASTATATTNALHMKPKFKALNLTSQATTHFVKDARQSPTIGQTPKRLAATAAALAEEAANTEAVPPSSGESGGKSAAKRSRPTFLPELNGATATTTTTTTVTTTATTVFPVGDCGAVGPGSGEIATSASVGGGMMEGGSTEVPEELISLLSSSSSSTCREEADHMAFLRSCKREPPTGISFHADGKLSSLAQVQHRVSPTATLAVNWQSVGGLQQRSVQPAPSLAPPPPPPPPAPAAVSTNVNVEEGSEKSAESSRRKCKDEAVSEDEAARREKRRERNRVAAAKCRQNRQNQIENLNKKVTDLKATREELLRRLQATETEKIQLEETIRQHGLTGCPAVNTAFRHQPPSFSYGVKPQANMSTCRDLKRTDSPVTSTDWSAMVTAKQEPPPCEPAYAEGDSLPLSIPPPRSDDSGLSFAADGTVTPVTTGTPSTPQFPQFPIGFSLVVLSSPNATSLNSSIDLPALTQQLTSAPKSSVIHAFSDQQQQQQQQPPPLIKPTVSSQQTPSTRPSTLRLSESKDFDPNNQSELLLGDQSLWPNGSADLSAIITPSAERWLVRDIGSGLMSPLMPKQNPPGVVSLKVENSSSSVSSGSNVGPSKSFMPEGNSSPIAIIQTLESLTTPNKTFPGSGAGGAEEAAAAPPVSVKLASNVSR